VLLEGAPELIAERLAARQHEYMNPNLLGSQLKTLEPPSEGESFRIVNDQAPSEIVDQILSHIRAPKSIESSSESVSL
jgi:gluconokinase